MNSKICNGCGRTNLAEAKNCIYCGLPISGVNPFESGEDLLKTVAVGQNEIQSAMAAVKSEPQKEQNRPTESATKGSNTKLYWILGGLGALVLVGGFLVVALATGIYIYASSDDSVEIAQKKPAEKTANDEEDYPERDTTTDFVKYTDSSIKDFITDYKGRVGVFRLKRSVSPKNKFFAGSNAEQVALYSKSGSKKDAIIINVATYKTIEETKRFVKEKLDAVVSRGGRVVKHTKKTRNDSVIFNEKGKHGEIIECNEGLCVAIAGTTPGNVADFYGAFFKK